MTFVRAIAERGLQELVVLENDDEALGSIFIGHDDETGALYKVLVGLPKYLPYLPDGREIHFDVVEVAMEDGQPDVNVMKDGMQTRRFLKGSDRKFALSCICTIVNTLVSRANPDTIVMMTVTPDLPKKALKKYQLICDALKEIGYDGGRDSSFHGTQIWIMTRITHGT